MPAAIAMPETITDHGMLLVGMIMGANMWPK
jgi:hypothetical protein